MDANLTAAIVGGIVGLLTSTLPMLYQMRRDKRTAPHDSISRALKDSEESLKLVKEYRDELDDMREELRQVRGELETVRKELADRDAGIKILLTQFDRLKIPPDWRPRKVEAQ